MVASLSPIKSASRGANYYENDGYYAKDSPEHRLGSFWHGKGVEELGLKGHVNTSTFLHLLEGYVPDTTHRLGRIRDGQHQHRAGTDLTLSVPKSVSLAALVSGDRRIIDSQNTAVRTTLDYVEKNIVETRMKTHDGKVERTGNQKLVVATFKHEESRNLDPQLHTHCVLLNMLKGEDGKWRTMENRSIFENKMLIGAVYHNALASELKKLGYQIEQTGKNNIFELKGLYTKEQLEGFSTRSADIREALRAKGQTKTPELAAKAALFTRAAKGKPDREALKALWKERAAELGIAYGNHTSGQSVSLPDEPAQKTDSSLIALQAARWAAKHLEERNSVFYHNNYLAEMYRYALGDLNEKSVDLAIKTLVKEGRLVRANLHKRDAFTTDRTLASEREMLTFLGAAKGTSKPFTTEQQAKNLLEKYDYLTKGQKQAITTILSHDDRIVAVQGYAGSGKTAMLRQIKDLAKDGQLLGFAPSASAARTLEKESGIESKTLQSFLAKYGYIGRNPQLASADLKREFRDKIIIVDESSLASTIQMRDLLAITDTLEPKKVVLVGDIKQLDAVDAGTAFAQLQKAGMTTAVMDRIMRQRNPDLKAAVVDALSGQPVDALRRIDENIREVKHEMLAKVAAYTWLGLDENTRKHTGIMAPTHILREEINEIIRDELKQFGLIAGESAEITKLVSTRLTIAEKEQVANWDIGHIALFEKDIQAIGVEAGDKWEITEKNKEFVHITHEDGREAFLDPAGGVAHFVDIYEPTDMELQPGDTIRWTRNDNEKNLINTHQSEVVDVQEGYIYLINEDGREINLPIDSSALSHCDYAFNATVHAFQGRTVDQVIAILESGHTELTTQKTFYVEVSRARDRAILITDDKEQLADTLSWNTGDRISALEGVESMVETQGSQQVKDCLIDALENARIEIEYGMSLEEFESLHGHSDEFVDNKEDKDVHENDDLNRTDEPVSGHNECKTLETEHEMEL